MTSTSLYSKGCRIFSLRLFSQKMGQYLWLTALWSIVVFFSLPVYQAFVIQNVSRASLGPDLIAERINGMFSFSNTWLLVFAMTAAIITALVVYHHMNSRIQTDFYNSQPVSRVKRFVVDYISGFAMFAIPLIAGWGISMGMTILFGYAGPLDISGALGVLGFLLLAFLIIYAVTIFAAVVCGNPVVALLLTGVLLVYFPSFFGGIMALCDRFYQTFYASEEWLTLMVKSSPAAGLVGYSVTKSGNFEVPVGGNWLIGMSLLSLVLLALALLFYTRRKSEAAGKALAFRSARPIIKYGVTFVVTIFGGLLFESIGGTIGWMIFGFLCGLVLTTGIINVIYNYEFKSFFSGWKGLLVFSAAFALFMGGLSADLTGYDRKTITREEVASVRFDGYSLTSNYSSGFTTAYESDVVIGAAVRLSELGLENLGKFEKKNTIYDPEERNISRQVILQFTRKDGSKMTRQYYIPENDAAELFGQIQDSAEYRTKEMVSKLDLPAGWGGHFELGPNNNAMAIPAENGRIQLFNQGDKDALVKALKKDIMENLSSEYAAKNLPLFTVLVTEVPVTQYGNSYLTEYYFPVYANYTNTLALADAKGLNYQWQFDPATVEEMKVVYFGGASGGPATDSGYEIAIDKEAGGQVMKVTDPELIRQILTRAYVASGQTIGYPVETAPDYSVQITFKDTDYAQHYSFLAGQVPQFVSDYFAGINATKN